MSNIELDAGLVGELSLHLGRQTKALERLVEMQRQASLVSQPFWYREAVDGIVPASGILVLAFPIPPMGEYHDVRQLGVGGISPTIASAGIADVFVSAADLRNAATPMLQDWRDRASTLPLVAFYGEGEMSLRGQALQVRFSGATPGQTYSASLTVKVFREGVRRQVTQ